MPEAALKLAPHAVEIRDLSVTAPGREILRHVSLDVPAQETLALLGPSGAGKTTLLKCLNRLIDLVPGVVVQGTVRLSGRDIYAPGTDVDELRARVGMLFQQPVVFPGSIADNVLFGLRRRGRVARREWPMRLERALSAAVLWDEVKDRLTTPAGRLSVGQQQRLCLARALALEPEMLLLDEPTSALDVRSAAAIEALILELKRQVTIVLVTHNVAQAERVADSVACICVRDGAGELLDCAADARSFAPGECRAAIEAMFSPEKEC